MQVINQDSPSELREQLRAQHKAALEALESSIPTRVLTFNWVDPGGQPITRVYVQSVLGMFATEEFGDLLTDIVDQFTEGEMGDRIGDLFRGEVQAPVITDGTAVQSFLDDNMMLVKAFIKAIRMIPGMQFKIYCLSLGIPRPEREWATLQMQEPPYRGGLSVDEGFELLNVFLVQNAELLREKLMGKARELVDTFALHILQREPAAVEGTATPLVPQPSSPGGTPSSTSSVPTPV